MRAIAMYLPQFHTFPENDEWWGKGYTEWTAVKNAKPLFKKHVQPRIPMAYDYYDLSEEDGRTLKRQAKLAEQMGLYGFCFYHYYFKGKLLMEKPLEILLKHPEIKMRYCLCWANESWTRAWYDKQEEVLLEQTYGKEPDWEAHAEYLIRFFKDERYIKIDNKPVLNIYRTFDISYLSDMLNVLTKKTIDAGLEGLYVVGARTAGEIDNRKEQMDAYYYFEPGYTLKHDMNLLHILSYDIGTGLRHAFNGIFKKEVLERRIPVEHIYKPIIKREYAANEFPGIFLRWDNTPRRGHKGLIYTGTTPAKFEKALRALKNKVDGRENDFVYINAWNEWGEGAMLEPDVQDGFEWIEAFKRVMDEQ